MPWDWRGQQTQAFAQAKPQPQAQPQPMPQTKARPQPNQLGQSAYRTSPLDTRSRVAAYNRALRRYE